jgi:hypothetical protein
VPTHLPDFQTPFTSKSLDDTRAHVTMACEAHHLQQWLKMEGHGRIRVSANDRDTTQLRRKHHYYGEETHP